jgi:acyl-CoA thioesterase-1
MMMGQCRLGRLSFALIASALLICVLAVHDARAAGAEFKVAFYGDSLVAGFGLQDPARDSVTAKLGRLTAASTKNKNVRFINLGLSGETTSGALARLPQLIALRPDVAVLVTGGNDLLRGIDPEITLNNLDVMIRELQRNGIYVMLTGMKAPPSMGAEYAAHFNRVYPKLADLHPIAFYPFFLEGVAGKPEFNQPDGIHPTSVGVDVIVKRLYPEVIKVVERVELAKRRIVEQKVSDERERKGQIYRQRLRDRALNRKSSRND